MVKLLHQLINAPIQTARIEQIKRLKNFSNANRSEKKQTKIEKKG